jgi:prevent-host-death family protein
MVKAYSETRSATAAEVSRNFGQWQDQALTGPVVVTHHGRPRVVIVSAAQFADQSETHDRLGGQSHEGQFESVLQQSKEAFFALDAVLNVTNTNTAFDAVVGRGRSEILGHSWEAAFPGARLAVTSELFHRVMRTEESVEFSLTIPSRSNPALDRQFSGRAFPHQGGVGVLMINCTGERHDQAIIAEAASIRKALSALSAVALVRLNTRGVMAGRNEQLAQISGFSESELQNVRLTDLLRPQDRGRVAQYLDLIHEGAPAKCLHSALMTKGGSEVDVELAAAAIIRDGAVGGLCVLISLQDDPSASVQPAGVDARGAR